MIKHTFDHAGFEADVEAIRAECRRRRAADRAAFWERTMDLTDEQWDRNNAVAQRDWFVKGETY